MSCRLSQRDGSLMSEPACRASRSAVIIREVFYGGQLGHAYARSTERFLQDGGVPPPKQRDMVAKVVGDVFGPGALQLGQIMGGSEDWDNGIPSNGGMDVDVEQEPKAVAVKQERQESELSALPMDQASNVRLAASRALEALPSRLAAAAHLVAVRSQPISLPPESAPPSSLPVSADPLATALHQGRSLFGWDGAVQATLDTTAQEIQDLVASASPGQDELARIRLLMVSGPVLYEDLQRASSDPFLCQLSVARHASS